LALVKALPFTDPEVLATFVGGIPKVLDGPFAIERV
jgi:hypothetical protein